MYQVNESKSWTFFWEIIILNGGNLLAWRVLFKPLYLSTNKESNTVCRFLQITRPDTDTIASPDSDTITRSRPDTDMVTEETNVEKTRKYIWG